MLRIIQFMLILLSVESTIIFTMMLVIPFTISDPGTFYRHIIRYGHFLNDLKNIKLLTICPRRFH